MDEAFKDPRFSNIILDPKYRHVPKKERKIILDSRFSSMFKNEEFYKKVIVDPRGRKTNCSTQEDLKKFYHLSSDEESETDEESDDDNFVINDKQNKDDEEIMNGLSDMTQDYARGKAVFSDDSSDDDSSTTDSESADECEFEWGELDRDAIWDAEDCEVEESSRLAVCNMDWDRIKAVDLMVLFTSFIPRGGYISSVSIYLSEYGKARLVEEEAIGPQELVQLPKQIHHNVDRELKHLQSIEKGSLECRDSEVEVEIEALRRYQRNRLKYYYAVIDCDSTETANVIYKECDQKLFETAGVYLDLRYIPSDMIFEEEPYDICSAVPNNYEAKTFKTSALYETKPTLTWDETDPDRVKTLSSAMQSALKGEDIDEEILKHYIASDSNESNSENEDNSNDDKSAVESIVKFRSLIQSLSEKNSISDQVDKEVTFEIKDEIKSQDNEFDLKTESPSNLTPFEKYIEKKKTKRKEKEKKKKIKNKIQTNLTSDAPDRAADNEQSDSEHANLELLLMDSNDNKEHFSMREIVKANKLNKKRRFKELKKKKIQAQKEKKIADSFQVDVSDPRFTPLWKSGDYNIDPSHHAFKSTKAVEKLIEHIQNKRCTESNKNLPEAKKTLTAKSKELMTLVSKVKNKTKKRKCS